MEEKKRIPDSELNAEGGKALKDIGRLSPCEGSSMVFATAEHAAAPAYTGNMMVLADSELNAEGGMGGAGFPTHVKASPHVRQQEEAFYSDAEALDTHHQYIAGYQSDKVLLDEDLYASGGTVVLCDDRKKPVAKSGILFPGAYTVSGPGAGKEAAIRAEAADSLNYGRPLLGSENPAASVQDLPWGDLGIDMVLE